LAHASESHEPWNTPSGRFGHSFETIPVQFEHAFDADLSAVEVRRDGRAEAFGSLAYAQGESIHLASSAPPVASHPGRALLGHELTHVVQQRQGRVEAPRTRDARVVNDQRLEAEADRVGARVARGEVAPPEIRSASGPASGAAMQGKAGGAPIQMFGALEHKTMGDVGGQQQPYRWDTASEAATGKRDVNYGFQLTHGDIVMLSGDLFDPREVDEKGNPVPDNLFQLARTPGNKGTELGTQDEIMYAIYREKPNDVRFQNVCPSGTQSDKLARPDATTPEPTAKSPGPTVTFPLEPDVANPFRPFFADRVKKSVESRYLALASRNREHFAAPEGPASGGPKSGMRKSAGGSYREMHETAIQAAFAAGQRGEGIEDAMAYEAAAQHFLTDAFSSGHIRTPTGSIKSHWDGVYPNFWENLKGFIGHQMAVYLNKETNLATILGTVSYIEDDVRSTLEGKVASFPPLGFERLVALATHDVDNREGVKVINDLNEQWTAYGDGQMKEPGHGASQKFAIEAVALGCQDIRDAHKFPMVVVDPFAALQVDGPGGRKYKPEQKMPRVDPAFEKTELAGWDAKDLDDLWDNDIRSGSKYTYGMEITRSAREGDIKDQIAGMADMIDETKGALGKIVKLAIDRKGQLAPMEEGERNENVPIAKPLLTIDAALAHLEPRAAFVAGVQQPITTDTKGTLQRIIDYDPSTGQAWFNEDDAVMEEMNRMAARDKKANEEKGPGEQTQDSLKGLTMTQRATWAKHIMGGTVSSVSEDEEEAIVKLFETCPPAQRRQLYQDIEGHAWKGDYQEGWFTDDDELYNSLSGAELKKVRQLINESK